jgi:hypothetical protein
MIGQEMAVRSTHRRHPGLRMDHAHARMMTNENAVQVRPGGVTRC